MRQESGRNTGRWWVSAGCVGLVIAGAFIGATLYLGGPPTVGRAGLAKGPDPMDQGRSGPSLVRRKGSPTWGEAKSADWDLVEGGSEGIAVSTGSSSSPPTRHDSSSVGTDVPNIPTTQESFSTETPTTSTTQRTTSTTKMVVHPSPTESSSATNRFISSSYTTALNSLSSSTSTTAPSTRKTAHHRHRAVKEPSAVKPLDIDWDEIMYNVNRSLSPRLSQRLQDLADLDPAALIKNTSSLVSFGLLAVDLFLLHNVQRIAFTETAGKQLSQDPEVVALNSLFDGVSAGGGKQRSSGVVGEVLGFLQGAVRGVVNLGRAYRRTHRARSVGPSTLDCIWTLYCRNLDKTAKIGGPYGFLAKMNSLGLRLMLGEFAPEDALERLMKDMAANGSKLDCNTLFPRCGAEEAKRVVLATAQGDRGTQV